MLSLPSEQPMATEDHTTVSPVTAPQDLEAVQAIMEVLAASPEFRNPPDVFGEYMTSPFDSPFDDFLTTPALESADVGADILTSPMIELGDGDFSSYPLFGDLGLDTMNTKADQSPSYTLRNDFEELYTLSPQTPSLDPSAIFPQHSPSLPTSSPAPSTSTRRRTTATGTRKNITPDSLVPLDAPTQPRKYTTPSATSRKEVPAVFARKRARSQAFGDEEDQLSDETFVLPPNPTEAQLIEAKRRQNTIAARRSRKRKLEHQRELEEANEQLAQERDHWKARALTSEALLKHHGLEVPNYDS